MNMSITRWAGAAVLAAAIAVSGTACGSSSPAPSAACQKATATADAYATWVAANTSYPNDSPAEGMQIMATELGLQNDMIKAGCPGSTPITPLPGS
jgi:hypothetical protein